MQRAQARDPTCTALLGMIGFTALMFEGPKRIRLRGRNHHATLPTVVAQLRGAVVRERMTIAQAGAVGLAVAGFLLVAAGAERRTTSLHGSLLVVGAVVCKASFVILGKRLAPPYQPLRLALGDTLVGLAGAAPLALLELPLEVRAISWATWMLATWVWALRQRVFAFGFGSVACPTSRHGLQRV